MLGVCHICTLDFVVIYPHRFPPSFIFKGRFVLGFHSFQQEDQPVIHSHGFKHPF